jgi:hypothetical protein
LHISPSTFQAILIRLFLIGALVLVVMFTAVVVPLFRPRLRVNVPIVLHSWHVKHRAQTAVRADLAATGGPSGEPATRDEPKDDRDQGHHEQEMNEPVGDV